MFSDSKSHFYIREFLPFQKDGDVPNSDSFYKKLVQLHSSHSSDGKFGFHCTTYNGNIPQDNNWSNSWEDFFAKALRRVLAVREERVGQRGQREQSAKLDALLPMLFDKVIPRLLRPLESHGRQIKPSLVHGDLWCGNIGIVDDTKSVVYDGACFWAHNECMSPLLLPTRKRYPRRTPLLIN